MSQKFHIILADCPWQYTDKKKSGIGKCGAENHYPTLNMEELKKLDIQSISEKNCVLFMWTTFPLLQESLDTIKAWGFQYKTGGFTWIKMTSKGTPFFGVGSYSKSNSEFVLMAVKGNIGKLTKNTEGERIIFDPKFKLCVASNHVSSVVMSPLMEHSQKPQEVHTRIEELFGDVSRIELFARRETPGWVCVGNEIDGMDIRDTIKRLNGTLETPTTKL